MNHYRGGLGDAFRAQRRSWGAILQTDLSELFENMGAKFFLKLVEPFFVLGVALCWHTLLNVPPPYGTSRVLFLVTGYYPLHLVVEVASGFWVGSRQGAHLRRYPAETMLDQVLVGGFIEAVFYIGAGVIGFYLMYLFLTPDALPFDLKWIALSIVEMVALGFACGLCNAFLQQHIKLWRGVWIAVSRSLILFSGIFYVPSFLPPSVRDLMSWNPALQGVEAFRFGIYPGYPSLMFFPEYLWTVVICLFLTGLVGDRVFRRSAM